jgi:anti-anti-sigma factor
VSKIPNRRSDLRDMSDVATTPRPPRSLPGFGLPAALVERDGSTLVVRICGPTLGQHEAPELARIVGRAIEGPTSRPSRIVLDLSAVAAISSVGLGTCLDLRCRCEAVGGQMVLVGLSRHLRNVIRTMRLDRLFTILESDHALFRRYAPQS